jgi:phosphohistidine phosphatase
MKKTAPEGDQRLIVLVRHAQAGDPERFAREQGRPDHERPLTSEGRARNRAAAAGLRRILRRIDHLWSSPYQRARQTADGIAAAFGVATRAPDDLRPPWTPAPLAQWLTAQVQPGETAVLVGHEPDLSTLVGVWLGVGGVPPVSMEKGSACALLMTGEILPGRVELLWKLPQHALRRL